MPEKLAFLSDDHHYAIAAVATRAAQLDAHIEMAIARVLEGKGFRNSAEHILKNMNGDRYVGLLRNMFIDCLPDRQQQIEDAFAQIAALRTERNEILHWLYGKSDDAALAISAHVRPYRERKERSKTAKQIQETANSLLELAVLISEWQFLALGLTWPPSSPDKPEPLAPQPNSA
jgi:hypothetical protein